MLRVALGVAPILCTLAADPAWSTTGACLNNGSGNVGWTGHSAYLSGDQGTEQVWGEFGNEQITCFGMDTLPTQEYPNAATVKVELELYVIGEWHGSTPGSESFFAIESIATNSNGSTQTTHLHATFSTFDSEPQSYPDDFGEGQHPNGTGSFESNYSGRYWDVYAIAFEFPMYVGPDCCNDYELRFEAEGLNAQSTWALDNVIVSLAPIPEPGTAALVGLGSVLLGSLGRRRSAR